MLFLMFLVGVFMSVAGVSINEWIVVALVLGVPALAALDVAENPRTRRPPAGSPRVRTPESPSPGSRP